jgi:hypothetical protein
MLATYEEGVGLGLKHGAQRHTMVKGSGTVGLASEPGR